MNNMALARAYDDLLRRLRWIKPELRIKTGKITERYIRQIRAVMHDLCPGSPPSAMVREWLSLAIKARKEKRKNPPGTVAPALDVLVYEMLAWVLQEPSTKVKRRIERGHELIKKATPLGYF